MGSSAGFNVLISDLDVVWLNGHWRWMTWAEAASQPPVPQAAVLAADVLVTTDELDTRDTAGPSTRWSSTPGSSIFVRRAVRSPWCRAGGRRCYAKRISRPDRERERSVAFQSGRAWL